MPDEVFAANDNAAIGSMLALKKARIGIPTDFSFVGFNNDPVTTVMNLIFQL